MRASVFFLAKDKLLCVLLPFFLFLSPQKVKADDDDDIPVRGVQWWAVADWIYAILLCLSGWMVDWAACSPVLTFGILSSGGRSRGKKDERLIFSAPPPLISQSTQPFFATQPGEGREKHFLTH